MTFNGYPQNKESGMTEFGLIPSHWTIRPLAAASNLIQTGPFGSQLHASDYIDDGVPIVNPSHIEDGRVRPSAKHSIRFEKASELGRHRLSEGDVIAARRGELGRCAVVDTDAVGYICGTGSLLIRLDENALIPAYFQMLFSSYANRERLAQISEGSTMDNLNAGIVARLPMCLPPVDEQREIVAFLDSRCASIDALIAKQEQLIATLREDRTATITHAVTQGLDPYANLKQSGIEWLGPVPVHWSTRRLGTTYRELDERLGNREAPELLSVSIHLGVRPRRELVTDKEARADDFTRYKLCSAGDVVLNRMRAFQGGLGVADQDGIVSPDYMVMRVHSTECADFLGYLMKTPWFVEQMTARLRGIGGIDQGNARTPRINPRDLGSIEVALPPTAEQREIVDCLRKELSNLDDLLSKTSKLVETMREYRSALITDAVTGKIDVREAA